MDTNPIQPIHQILLFETQRNGEEHQSRRKYHNQPIADDLSEFKRHNTIATLGEFQPINPNFQFSNPVEKTNKHSKPHQKQTNSASVTDCFMQMKRYVNESNFQPNQQKNPAVSQWS